jgi:hypothetical protein
MVSSFAAGIVTAVIGAPNDIVKTRIMNDKNNLYTGAFDCLNKTYKSEGIKGLFKGTNARWIRIGPMTMFQFMIWESLRDLFGISPI